MARNSTKNVAVFKVNPTVWAQALELADGDGRRIEIRGEFDVVVHNEPLPPNERMKLSAAAD
ncbi:hypothetical protein G1H11_11765 [Phytoactinopolyspora alkaliphila]|uniref:Uncharacterized protein n=1 Tax=Phytoactinopolyspora alkaliphila TaxID=1783498 RepID=A0A6N9YLT2_9ACTN|nr:hypothetical protein [Phytoactinopolyspora alkaliphila]NED95986.1 hypothetical protein [Phytoactinopolyspora alkaliphila]